MSALGLEPRPPTLLWRQFHFFTEIAGSGIAGVFGLCDLLKYYFELFKHEYNSTWTVMIASLLLSQAARLSCLQADLNVKHFISSIPMHIFTLLINMPLTGKIVLFYFKSGMNPPTQAKSRKHVFCCSTCVLARVSSGTGQPCCLGSMSGVQS